MVAQENGVQQLVVGEQPSIPPGEEVADDLAGLLGQFAVGSDNAGKVLADDSAQLGLRGRLLQRDR